MDANLVRSTDVCHSSLGWLSDLNMWFILITLHFYYI